MDLMNVSAKFEVYSFSCSWVNRGYAAKKFGAVHGYAHTIPFPLPPENPMPIIQTIHVCALVFPWLSIGVSGGGANVQSREECGCRGSGWYRPKEHWRVPIDPTYILFIYQHVTAWNFRLQFWVGVANPQSSGRWSRRGSGMVAYRPKQLNKKAVLSQRWWCNKRCTLYTGA